MIISKARREGDYLSSLRVVRSRNQRQRTFSSVYNCPVLEVSRAFLPRIYLSWPNPNVLCERENVKKVDSRLHALRHYSCSGYESYELRYITIQRELQFQVL
jgi:hypothetical protein